MSAYGKVSCLHGVFSCLHGFLGHDYVNITWFGYVYYGCVPLLQVDMVHENVLERLYRIYLSTGTVLQ